MNESVACGEVKKPLNFKVTLWPPLWLRLPEPLERAQQHQHSQVSMQPRRQPRSHQANMQPRRPRPANQPRSQGNLQPSPWPYSAEQLLTTQGMLEKRRVCNPPEQRAYWGERTKSSFNRAGKLHWGRRNAYLTGETCIPLSPQYLPTPGTGECSLQTNAE